MDATLNRENSSNQENSACCNKCAREIYGVVVQQFSPLQHRAKIAVCDHASYCSRRSKCPATGAVSSRLETQTMLTTVADAIPASVPAQLIPPSVPAGPPASW